VKTAKTFWRNFEDFLLPRLVFEPDFQNHLSFANCQELNFKVAVVYILESQTNFGKPVFGLKSNSTDDQIANFSRKRQNQFDEFISAQGLFPLQSRMALKLSL